MNQHVAMRSFAAAAPARRARFHPRLDILDEVVAGFLWMQLDLPQDISRGELECVAHRLVGIIQSGGEEGAIVREIAGLQFGQLCRPANLSAIHDLARRTVAAVAGAHSRL
ncbi:MAG: hypothetical protein ACREFW_02240 [Rhizomicrobium sp.]